MATARRFAPLLGCMIGLGVGGCSSGGQANDLYLPSDNPAVADELAVQVGNLGCLTSLASSIVEAIPAGDSKEQSLFETTVFVREMKVTSAEKGTLGDQITVVMGFGALSPEGRYESPMVQDTSYLLFLEPLVDPKGAVVEGWYVPVGGPQGVYVDVEGSKSSYARYFAGQTQLPEVLSIDGIAGPAVEGKCA